MTTGSALFTAGGVWMIFDAASSDLYHRTIGILTVIFFGVGILISVIQLLPGAGWLRLDENGFEATSFFFRRQRYRWTDSSDFSDFSDFSAWGIPLAIVVFRALKRGPGVLKKVSASVTGGRNCSLPDTYGMRACDLARLMTAWQKLALAAASDSPKAPAPIPAPSSARH